MIPEIGIIIGFYILTRNFEILDNKKTAKTLAGISTVITGIVILDLVLRSM